MPATPIYFEDLAPGRIFTSAPLTMDADAITAFARTYDPQPQHLGDAEAAGTLFGRLIASGWHTAALTMRLQVDTLLSRAPGGVVGAQIDTLTWPRPTFPGDTLHIEIEVMEARPSRSRPDRGVVTLRTRTLNQNDETVLEMTAAVLFPRRPA